MCHKGAIRIAQLGIAQLTSSDTVSMGGAGMMSQNITTFLIATLLATFIYFYNFCYLLNYANLLISYFNLSTFTTFTAFISYFYQLLQLLLATFTNFITFTAFISYFYQLLLLLQLLIATFTNFYYFYSFY